MDCSTPGVLSFTISWSLLRVMSIESMMPSNHLILYCPLPLLPSVFLSIRVFSSKSTLHIRCQSIRASASVSVLSMNIQGWFPLRLTVWFPYCSGDSQESSPAPWFESISSSVLTFLCGPTLMSIRDYWKKQKLWLDGALSTKWYLCFLIPYLVWSWFFFQGPSTLEVLASEHF